MLSMQHKTNANLFLFLALFFAPFFLQANDSKPSGDLKTEIKEYISHHLEDAYDFSLFSYTNASGEHIYIGIPLPVILWDDGLQIFSSSKGAGQLAHHLADHQRHSHKYLLIFPVT